MNCMFNANFKAEWAVLPLGSNVAAISDEARAKAMSFWDRIAARINLIKNILPVPPGASKKKIPPTPLLTVLRNRAVSSLVSRCSTVSDNRA